MDNTTHDWAKAVDADHLALIRAAPDHFAPGGLTHLVLEVLAYPEDEAADRGRRGICVVTFAHDGTVTVADDGRGTDTRTGPDGAVLRKPVMATQDLRFFDRPGAQILADGHPRRGMSVVAALSPMLVHTNRRLEGAWSQRYAHGIPADDLTTIEPDGTTGTSVRFRAGDVVLGEPSAVAAALRTLAAPDHLDLVIVEE